MSCRAISPCTTGTKRSTQASVSAPSDGYRLNAALRSSHPIPTTAIVDTLASLAFEMRQACQGNPVLVEQWVQWAKKSHINIDALIRTLFLIVGVADMTHADVVKLMQDMRDTSAQRRRPPRLIREPRKRDSQQLW